MFVSVSRKDPRRRSVVDSVLADLSHPPGACSILPGATRTLA
jgi:hypothetical protein